MINRILNTKAAALYLGISASALGVHRFKGTGPAWFRLTDGKKAPCFYAIDDLDQWIEKRRRKFRGIGHGQQPLGDPRPHHTTIDRK